MHSITRDCFFPPPDMNIVFEYLEGKYDNSELYQDILKYARKRRDQQGFKFSHVGRWLINENIEFRSYYTGSKAHVPKSARLANKRQRIQGCIDNLVQWDLIRVIGKVKAEKNEFDTQLFESTLEGNLLSYLFEVNSTTDGNSDVAIKSLLDLVESLAKKIDSSILNFVFEFFKRCKYFGSIISHFMRIVLPRSRTSNGKELMVLFFGLKNIINWVLADEEAFWGGTKQSKWSEQKDSFFLSQDGNRKLLLAKFFYEGVDREKDKTKDERISSLSDRLIALSEREVLERR